MAVLQRLSAAILPTLAAAEFQVHVDGWTLDCRFHSQSNSYSTGTKTTTVEDYWQPNTYSGKYPTNYDLAYQRTDGTHAEGGRCQTSGTTAIAGSGTFSAEIYIHSNVRSSTGVFTIAAMPEVFDVNYELDLFVVNLADNVIKSGRPFHAQVFKMSDVEQRWITFKMIKSGDTCTTSISDSDTGAVLVRGSAGSCNLSDKNHVVVNVRARDGGSDSSDHSFVSVRKIKWQSATSEDTIQV